jgi:hypothetical protein
VVGVGWVHDRNTSDGREPSTEEPEPGPRAQRPEQFCWYPNVEIQLISTFFKAFQSISKQKITRLSWRLFREGGGKAVLSPRRQPAIGPDLRGLAPLRDILLNLTPQSRPVRSGHHSAQNLM